MVTLLQAAFTSALGQFAPWYRALQAVFDWQVVTRARLMFGTFGNHETIPEDLRSETPVTCCCDKPVCFCSYHGGIQKAVGDSLLLVDGQSLLHVCPFPPILKVKEC